MLGLGLTEYLPYVIYALSFVIAFLALFYRPEIGIVFIATLLPVYVILNKVIRMGLPFGKDIIDIIMIAMILGSLFRRGKFENQSIGESPLVWPIFLFLIYTVISFIVGWSYLAEDLPDLSSERLAHWKNYIIMPFLYLIAYYSLRERKWQYILFISLFFSFLASDYYFYSSFRWVKHIHYVERSRLAGTLAFLGPNEWGSFHTIYTLFIIGLFLVDKHFWRRAAYLLLIFCNTYSLMYSFSRGSYIGFLVGLTFIGIVRKRILLVLLFIFLLSWKSIVPLSVRERVEGTFVEAEEVSKTDVIEIGEQKLDTVGRTKLWRMALDYFTKNPILGTGYNTYQRLSGKDTHNIYLKTMAEQGTIGLLLYLWFYALAFRSGWRLYRGADEELAKAFGFGFVCAVVGSMIVNFFGDRWTYLQLGGLYWIFWALVDQENARITEAAKEEAISEKVGTI